MKYQFKTDISKEEYDKFVKSFPNTSFMQTTSWAEVKSAWKRGKEFDYVYQLKETNQLLIKELGLNLNKTLLLYSSQRGSDWLRPFLNKDIADLPKLGWKNIAVVAPGFPVDNLETLYDIDIEARNMFMKYGGEKFIFVSSLNAEDYWIDALWKMISTM